MKWTMSIKNSLSLSHVPLRTHWEATNMKAKPNSKWNPLISSENEPWKKGARKGEKTRLFWGDRTRETTFFYHFWTRNCRRLEWTANKANSTSREGKLIRDVRRIHFRIKLLYFLRRRWGFECFWQILKFSEANDTECCNHDQNSGDNGCDVTSSRC